MVLSLLRFLVYGNIFIALCFIAISVYAYSLLNFIPKITTSAFIFTASVSHYTLHRLLFLRLLQQAKEPLPSRFLWVLRNKRFLMVQVLLCTLTAIYFYIQLGFHSKVFLLPFLILGALYLTPFKKSLSIRSISYTKNILLTISIVCIAFGLPVIDELGFEKLETASEYLPQFFSLMLYIFGIAIVFDIRDFWLDKHFGIKTLPMLLGRKWLKLLSVFCVALSLYLLYDVGINLQALLLIGVFSLFFILLSTTYRTNLFYGLVGDACLLLYALVLTDMSQMVTFIQLLLILG